jgi:homopolymeric O-antigen transport system permease protein
MTALPVPLSPPRHLRVIQARTGWRAVDFKELWRYRELLYFLVWRDVKVRYKQTVFGILWAVVQPVMTMVVLVIFFGRFGGMAQNVKGSFAVFLYAALLPWQFFANSVNQSGQSLVSSANLISKIYFPRLFIPLAPVGSGLVDFSISFCVMMVLLITHGVRITPAILLLPMFLLGVMVVAVGMGTLLAALVIAYRDFRYVIGFVVSLWMFASPVAYPLHVIPGKYQFWYELNPMVGMIAGFRYALLGEPFPWGCFVISAEVSLLLLVVGVLYFRRVERRFADII